MFMDNILNTSLYNPCQVVPVVLVLIATVSSILNIYITYKPIKRILAILRYVCSTLVLLSAFFQLLNDSHNYYNTKQTSCNAETTLIDRNHYLYNVSTKFIKPISFTYRYQGTPPNETCNYIPCWYNCASLSTVKIDYYTIYYNSVINFVLVFCLLGLLFAI
jgi:hypothetical protein